MRDDGTGVGKALSPQAVTPVTSQRTPSRPVDIGLGARDPIPLSKGGPWPVDVLCALVHAASLLFIVFFAREAEGAALWFVWDLFIFAALFLILRDDRRGNLKRAATIRVIFTTLTIPLYFTQLGTILPYVNPLSFEAELAAFDRALFLGNDPLEALESITFPLLTEYLQWVYDFYYFIPIAIAAVVIKRRDALALARLTFVFALCIYVSYLGYFLVPATGPNMDVYGLYNFDGPLRGLFLASELREALFSVEKIKLNCFPSGHTAVSVLALLLARRSVPKLAPLLSLFALSLVFSTLYLRYHYVADVLAGILLAVVSYRGGLAVHASFERRRWGIYGNAS